ncbi:MAG TPA: NnrS family protein [Anaeromyxobacter sp.]|nr:NnrS family protein [Anaeromyxobacter sp.]
MRRDPWRLFFPIGVALGWAGVLHWLAYGAGLSERYDAFFHATAQVQGFLTAIALGFLFTFVPRRTETPPPSAAALGAAAAAPIAATVLAWEGRWALAQVAWAACIAGAAAFVARRALGPGATRRLPPVFVWVPVALLAGIVGAVLVAVAAALGPREEPELWRLGRGLLLQGLVTALVVGVGGTMLPTLTRAEPPRLAADEGARRAGQMAAALLFLASFPLEAYAAPRLGLALRGAVAGGVLVSAARLWRPPSVPGLHRRLMWIAAWLLPVGFLAAAVVPSEQRVSALHVTFIGGFALLALAVALHVALSHSGQPQRLAGRPWQVWCTGVLLLAALAFRLLAGADPAHLRPWLALAAGCFLAGTLAWASLAGPAVAA